MIVASKTIDRLTLRPVVDGACLVQIACTNAVPLLLELSRPQAQQLAYLINTHLARERRQRREGKLHGR